MSVALAYHDTPSDNGARLEAAIREACGRIAPVWPLSSFVAVNPFLGFTDMPFAQAAAELRRLTGARCLMPRSFYREAVRDGRIEPADLSAALAEARSTGLTAERLLHAVALEPTEGPAARRVATVADVLDALSEGDRQASRTAFMADEISKWCAAYFDEGQAAWAAPWRSLPIYAAWRWSARFDGNPEAMGLKGWSATIAALPDRATTAIAEVLEALEIPADQWADYLYRALFDVRGWAAYVRRLDWEAELAGQPGGRLTDFLAVRLVWGYALFRQRRDEAFTAAWRDAMAAARPQRPSPTAVSDDLAVELVLHRAYEHAVQRRLIAALASAPAAHRMERPELQAVFCIDVRSEVYRRALETVWPHAETLGFAGFFGMPLSYGVGEDPGVAQCPVLLRPAFHASEAGQGASRAELAASVSAAALWARLKASAVSCFGFVESFGLAYGLKLAKAAAGHAHAPDHACGPLHHGLDLEQRIGLAEGALRGMSLVRGFAPLVLLVGHGATTVNNPHAAGLDCGACGGHSGAPNARFAAALLNDPEVRAGLADRGIAIPADTRFVAALHDTTTDDLHLLDAATQPVSHRAALVAARAKFDAASARARAERAPWLGLAAEDQGQVRNRSADWSQVRPEWGLARAAAFIAAPRALTAGRDLEGRAFLHSYDRHADGDLKVLELILTAPMVVASWISLQYYGSTVDNAAFGSGDKTLHNVCGRIGVLEGNAGDLRTGLPLQSLHDGTRFVHEPVRLNVFIAAAPEAMSQVLAQQPQVRALADNGWLHLFAVDDSGRTTHRYGGALSWEAMA